MLLVAWCTATNSLFWFLTEDPEDPPVGAHLLGIYFNAILIYFLPSCSYNCPLIKGDVKNESKIPGLSANER
ncbi:Uncharacterised protein [Chlamydia trachomatis]|nr:Uncharacterised protein [Chlamydia trachomatis]CRH46783.1 Uncharacterised protein [Chlamydia trachomatis]CRH54690.1 Uncharacterised protein [Chlamydia trachomatis]